MKIKHTSKMKYIVCRQAVSHFSTGIGGEWSFNEDYLSAGFADVLGQLDS